MVSSVQVMAAIAGWLSAARLMRIRLPAGSRTAKSRTPDDPAHPAVSEVVADLEAEGVAVEGQGCVRVVMRQEGRVMVMSMAVSLVAAPWPALLDSCSVWSTVSPRTTGSSPSHASRGHSIAAAQRRAYCRLLAPLSARCRHWDVRSSANCHTDRPHPGVDRLEIEDVS
jgi:hypothetical protein